MQLCSVVQCRDDDTIIAYFQGMHAPMHGPLDTPLQEENIQSSPKQTYNINVTDGSSPTQPSGSCSIERKEGDAGPSHIPWMPPTTQPLIGMVLCRYNSAPLPPLFAMLAAISGSDAPDGEQSDAAVPRDRDAMDSSEAAGADSMAISPAIGAASSTPDGSNEGSEAMISEAMKTAGPSADQHAFSTTQVSGPSSKDNAQSVDMTVEQNRMGGSQQQGSSEQMEHESESADDSPSAVPLHFGINEPVLMLNPDGSKVFVLLIDEQAAKDEEVQKRKEETAAAIAAAKAATYWVHYLIPPPPLSYYLPFQFSHANPMVLPSCYA